MALAEVSQDLFFVFLEHFLEASFESLLIVSIETVELGGSKD